jgi:beta-glucosidase
LEKTNLLQPGESQTITLEINAKDLAFVPTKTPGLLRLVIIKWQLDLLPSILKKALFSLANIKIVEKTTFTPDLKFTDLKH